MTKTCNINNIPAEIWESIFDKLPTCSQNECQRVCQRWYLPAQRSFLEHVVLASYLEVEKFISCFMRFGTAASFGSVKTIRIGSTYTTPDRARHLLESNAIETLIHHFPHVVELVISGNCIDLDYFLKRDIVKAMSTMWPHLQVFRVDSGWLHPDKRKIYLQTNYSLRKGISQLTLYEHNDVTHSMGGLEAYLTSFPNLQKIKVVSREICNLESCLPIIQHCQRLHALDVYVTREDARSLLDRFFTQNPQTDPTRFQQKLIALQSLKITMACFCTFAIEFIIHHLFGLRDLTVGVNRINVEEWTEIQKYTFSHGFLDFLCERKTFTFRSLQFNYNEENDYVNEVLHKLYHQLPPGQPAKRVEKHVNLILNNNSPESGADYNNMFSNIRNFVFEMGSKQHKDLLIRTASFTHFIQHEGGLRNKSLKYLGHMDSILQDITRLTFDAYGMWVLIHVVPKIFQDTIQQFPNLQQVTVHLSRNYPKKNSFLCRDITTVHSRLTHLEITAGNALRIEEDMFPLASKCFPSLRYLSLWFLSGWYNNHTFTIDMQDTELERLHLDVTPIRVQTEKIYNPPKPFFILKITTPQSFLSFRVASDYLSLQPYEEEEEALTVHLFFKSISFVNLYLYRKFSDQFRPVSVMDTKDLIQTTVCCLASNPSIP
ncbi:uncharacterized protein EV154DRAFT_48903 [Mucor mucedo]|uniref:uncharacterized protein n=1 Tax=Mucor mucedo TaxID=29922 RepID=UPI00221F4079|nr:uncharacterized protein EV154DRAFT_48903 [Mucor mucedo]KAI7894973.1 hypothetical protein EV154DRAFT_48903 [Mucor mucedo]